MQDPISDMFTRIRNAQMVNHVQVNIPYSVVKEQILKLLLSEGYISDYGVKKEESSVFKNLVVDLKYYKGTPVIDFIKRVSRPGLRVYVKKDEIPQVKDGLGIAILSTSKGIMTGSAASDAGCGGEVIGYVY